MRRPSSLVASALLFAVLFVGFGCRRRHAPTPASGGAEADAHEDPTSAATRDVTTDYGVVRGVLHGDSFAYRGIPYAAPPVGALRFAPPSDVPKWTSPRDASAWGACCPQLAGGKVEGHEDCLTLNVWTPKTGSPTPRAVMVFIHGGGNIQGCSAQEALGQRIYEGDVLASRRDVVVVTLNYRLGVLGFVAHDALGAASTNLGLRDQTAALVWVQKNIGAFGGDPKKVLLFGESAGAENTCAHVVSPHSKGLFTRALMESGMCPNALLAVAKKQGAEVAAKLGCGGGDVAACLRAKPFDALVSGAPGTTLFDKGIKYGPVIDGDVLVGQPLATMASGAHAHVPFAIGDNSDETLLWVKNTPIATEAAYRLRITEMLGKAKATEVLARYPVSAYANAKTAFVAATTDAVFICPARAILRALAKGQTEPAFRYLFGYAPQHLQQAAHGAAHGVELLFVFGHTHPGGYQPTLAEQSLADAMTDYWARFAATGDPNVSGRAAWPRYDVASDPYLKLDAAVTGEHGLHGPSCDFWDGIALGP